MIEPRANIGDQGKNQRKTLRKNTEQVKLF